MRNAALIKISTLCAFILIVMLLLTMHISAQTSQTARTNPRNAIAPCAVGYAATIKQDSSNRIYLTCTAVNSVLIQGSINSDTECNSNNILGRKQTDSTVQLDCVSTSGVKTTPRGDCSNGQYVYGIKSDGTPLCRSF